MNKQPNHAEDQSEKTEAGGEHEHRKMNQSVPFSYDVVGHQK